MRDLAGEVVPPDDEQLLLDAWGQRPGAWEALTARLRPYLQSIARRRLPDLPPDIRDEFLQEVWQRVAVSAPECFDPETHTAKAFVRQFVSPAINSVRADYCPAGRRTRDRSRSDEIVSRTEVHRLEDRRAEAALHATAARADVQRLLTVAEPSLRSGLQLMMAVDLPLAAAARKIRMPRETFRRKMIRLPEVLSDRINRRGRLRRRRPGVR